MQGNMIFYVVHQGRKYIQKCHSAMIHHILRWSSLAVMFQTSFVIFDFWVLCKNDTSRLQFQIPSPKHRGHPWPP